MASEMPLFTIYLGVPHSAFFLIREFNILVLARLLQGYAIPEFCFSTRISSH